MFLYICFAEKGRFKMKNWLLLFLVCASFADISPVVVPRTINSAATTPKSWVDDNDQALGAKTNELVDTSNVQGDSISAHTIAIAALQDSSTISSDTLAKYLYGFGQTGTGSIVYGTAPTIASPTITTSLTTDFLTNGRIPFYSSGLIDDGALTWDNTNGRLFLSRSVDAENYVSVNNGNSGTSAQASLGLLSDGSISLRSSGNNFNQYTLLGEAMANGAEISIEDKSKFIITTTNTAPVIIGTNNTEALRISSSQNIGLGNDNPNFKLDIKSTGINSQNYIQVTNSSDINQMVLVSDSTGAANLSVYDASGSEDVKISSNGDSYFNGGMLGVGISDPTGLIHLSNDLANRKVVLYDVSDNEHEYYGLGLNASVLRYQTDGSTSDHVFYSAIDSSSSLELMRINGSGAVSVNNLTASQAVFTDGSKNLVSNAITGSGSVVMSTSPTIATPTFTGVTTAADVDASSVTALTTTSALTIASGATSGDLNLNAGSVGAINLNSGSNGIDIDANSGTGTITLDGTTNITGPVTMSSSGAINISNSTDFRLSSYPDGSLSVSGGVVTSSSDKRLKKDIKPLGSTLDKVKRLRGVKYKWKASEMGGNEHIGFIAQELEKEFPELVGGSGQEENMKGVYYAQMTAVLLEAVKELSAKVDELERVCGE